jgi:hypothetical protein
VSVVELFSSFITNTFSFHPCDSDESRRRDDNQKKKMNKTVSNKSLDTKKKEEKRDRKQIKRSGKSKTNK